jgi:hypothetical protein
MRSRVFIGLTVVALCAWAAAVERPAPSPSDNVLIVTTAEPNGPNRRVPPPAPDPNKPWDPAEHLTATWEYVYVNMTSVAYNPVVYPNQRPSGPYWSLSLMNRLAVFDSNGLIGLSYSAASAKALDRNGHVVSSMPAGSSLSRYYQPLRFVSVPTGPNGELVTQLAPSSIWVDLPMDPGARFPSVLGRVDWSMNVLLAKETKVVDVPFVESETWIELAPGLEILVEKALAEPGEYQYSIRARWRSEQADYTSRGSLYLYRDAKPPAAMVLSMNVLDDQGKPIPGGSSGGSYTSLEGVMIGTNVGSAYGPLCGNATTIRYTVALNVYEKETRFAAENVPVPSF